MKRDILRRYRRRLRRLQLNFRRMNFTLIGDEGRPWRRAIAAAAVVLLLVFAAIFGRAETQLFSSAEVKTLRERGVLKVGIISDMPGYELEKQIGVRLAEKLLPDVEPDGRVEFVEVTPMTAGTSLDDGTVDMVVGHMSSGMASKYTYSESYYAEECLLAVKQGTSSFALKNFTVGYIQSNRLRKTAEDIIVSSYLSKNSGLNISKKAYASYTDMMDGLERGKIGGAALLRQTFNALRSSYDLTETTLIFGTIDYQVMCPGDSAVFSEVATIVIQEMKQSGELEQLYEQYGW